MSRMTRVAEVTEDEFFCWGLGSEGTEGSEKEAWQDTLRHLGYEEGLCRGAPLPKSGRIGYPKGGDSEPDSVQ